MSFGAGGTCTLTASQSGNSNYLPTTGQQSFEVHQAPAITSASATTFTASVPGSFTVTTSGHPTGAMMVLTQAGSLPAGVTFVDNHDGTATLAGTPAALALGTYPLLLAANNAEAPNATQFFLLTVN